MPQPIQVVLKTPPHQRVTVSVAAQPHTLSSAQLASGAGNVKAPVPQASQPPQSIGAPPVYNSLTLINPVDGSLVYVGQDSTVTPLTGHAFYPGNKLSISGYTGPIYVAGSNGGSSLFYVIT